MAEKNSIKPGRHDIGNRIAEVRNRQRQRFGSGPAQAQPVEDEPEILGQLVLPFGPDGHYPTPSAFLRSALFGIVDNNRDRETAHNVEITAVSGHKITFSGPRLDQQDLTVWLELLSIARENPNFSTTHKFRTTAYEVLKRLEMTDTAPNRAAVFERIKRLNASQVLISRPGTGGRLTNLIKEFVWDERAHTSGRRKNEWEVWISPKVGEWLAPGQYQSIARAVRLGLGKNQLALYLHAFFSSHDKSMGYGLERLRELCGSNVARKDHWREKVRAACAAVTQVSAAHGEGLQLAVAKDIIRPQRPRSMRSKQTTLEKLKTPRKA